jgi:purine nucleosidase
MRRFIIDTDTASDDAVALIMALRERSIKVEAITVVAGNLPVELAVKNALVSVEVANTYAPPVYQGMAKPLFRDLFTSEFVHGPDGMGEMNLAQPNLKAQPEHAVMAMLRLIEESTEDLELITLGPLTNVAMACLLAPETVKKLKRITVMGGAGLGSGNITPVAEFNIYVDAEAFNVVLQAGVPVFLVGWDVSMGTAFLNDDEINHLLESGSPIAWFSMRCNQSLREFNKKRLDKYGLDLPDPATVAAAIYPDVVIEAFDAYTCVECKSELTYGQVIIDSMNVLGKTPNAKICKALDGPKFKQYLHQLLLPPAG